VKPRQPGARGDACGAKYGRRDGRLKDEGQGGRLPSREALFLSVSLSASFVAPAIAGAGVCR